MKCARTWHEWRVEDCSVPYFPFFSLFIFISLYFMPAAFFLIHLLFVSSFASQMGCLGEEVAFKVWWLKTQGESWWAEEPDVSVTQAGVSWAHSLAEGQESWEVTVKGFICRVLATALAVPVQGLGCPCSIHPAKPSSVFHLRGIWVQPPREEPMDSEVEGFSCYELCAWFWNSSLSIWGFLMCNLGMC